MATNNITTGSLNRLIQIQQQTTTQDSYGQRQQTWNAVYQCWALIDIQASALIYNTAEFVSKVTHRITTRWTPSQVIEPNMRVLYTDPYKNVVHTYNIEAVLNPQEKNQFITLLCYELNGAE